LLERNPSRKIETTERLELEIRSTNFYSVSDLTKAIFASSVALLWQPVPPELATHDASSPNGPSSCPDAWTYAHNPSLGKETAALASALHACVWLDCFGHVHL
jgi:hypothetical protein